MSKLNRLTRFHFGWRWNHRTLALLTCSLWATGHPVSVTLLHAQELAPDGLTMMITAEATIQKAIERAAPSVVAIARVRRGLSRDIGAELQLGIPGLGQPGAELFGKDVVPTDFGSGVIISSDGAILTCYHLLDDPREHDYFVWLGSSEGAGFAGMGEAIPARVERLPVERLPAIVQAGDPWTDLAVLKIDAADLPVIPMGDAKSLRRGSIVISLGNPYATARDGQASASWGIVSNLQRRAPRQRASEGELNPPESLQEFGTLIQTDAKLNLGTSGGALINLRGEMVGLTTSLAAVAGFEQAAGYAIPIDAPALAAIAELRAGKLPSFGFLGVEPRDVGAGRGALILRVVPGMAADLAGIHSGDVIVKVDGQPIEDAQTLFREMSRRPADTEVAMTVVSPGLGQPRDLTAKLGKKRLALSRPAFSQTPEPTWRGMVVDFASALPPDRWMRGLANSTSEAAILRVDPDSAAWIAGIRPGQTIFQVAGKAVKHPDDFYAAVDRLSGIVEIGLENRAGSRELVRVAEEATLP